MQSTADTMTFVLVLCLPVVVWVLSRGPVWSRVWPLLRPLGARLWRQVVVDEAPDPADLQRWAVERLQRLRADLERVRLLLLDDEWMSGTRQVGNRLAYERLVLDVRRAESEVAGFAVTFEERAAPTPLAAPRYTFVAPSSQPAVEMIEFGPSGRWF
jgi:hypothetical protein